MFWIFGESVPAHGGVADACGLGALGLGLIPLAVYWARRPVLQTAARGADRGPGD